MGAGVLAADLRGLAGVPRDRPVPRPDPARVRGRHHVPGELPARLLRPVLPPAPRPGPRREGVQRLRADRRGVRPGRRPPGSDGPPDRGRPGVLPGVLGARRGDGALLGAALPGDLRGLDFALTALFAVLAVDGWRATRDVPGPVLALLCALAALLLAKGQLLVVALGLFVAALTVRYLLRGRRA
ncbi:hypothetical protein KCH_54410 [Kitasatospora cheerisanensis KCTC 2395]|uniref:Uncharacterized protein n=1 Tax=Kitasatospora cheerisanensis KCTC 2395 TaxID=1348663 RepID=A0A066YNP9_9ACTN|nr:hypothetical protein KCH_54410 [Kitasatospora cheerisanensis KCTC 2395]